jgi:hypothetical protein
MVVPKATAFPTCSQPQRTKLRMMSHLRLARYSPVEKASFAKRGRIVFATRLGRCAAVEERQEKNHEGRKHFGIEKDP